MVYLYSWIPNIVNQDTVEIEHDLKLAIQQGKVYRCTNGFFVDKISIEQPDKSFLFKERYSFNLTGHNARELAKMCPSYFFMENNGIYSYLKTYNSNYTNLIYHLECIIQIDGIEITS